MAEAMRRHESGDAYVIPIILRPVYWQDEPFNGLQVLPTGGKPVKSWSNIDEAFLDIANNIQRVVKGLLVGRYFNLIEKLCQENSHEEALITCEQAYRLAINNSNKASIHLLTANILLNLKKYEAALTAYEEAIQHDPGIADMNFFRNKGQALQYLERFHEAFIAYEQATLLGARDPHLYHNKGVVLERLAQQAYRMAERYS
jgi:tetratricopeptide (TPR) repeat protein